MVSSPLEKDLWVLADEKLDVSWQRAGGAMSVSPV